MIEIDFELKTFLDRNTYTQIPHLDLCTYCRVQYYLEPNWNFWLIVVGRLTLIKTKDGRIFPKKVSLASRNLTITFFGKKSIKKWQYI